MKQVMSRVAFQRIRLRRQDRLLRRRQLGDSQECSMKQASSQADYALAVVRDSKCRGDRAEAAPAEERVCD